MPPHRNLFNTVRSTVADAANFKVFPVSALGNCRKIDQGNEIFSESPVNTKPLRTFGLEEPFIWAAERCDAMRHQVWQRRRRLILILVLFIALALLFFQNQKDYTDYQLAKHAIMDPQATPSDVQTAENWLRNYTEFPYRHFFAYSWLLSRADAEIELSKLREKNEKIHWAEVENSNDPLESARAYLDKFPNGQHRIAAIEIVSNRLAQSNWNDFERSYDDYLKEGKTVEATGLLKARASDPRIASLKQTFESIALRAVEDNIRQALLQNRIEDAYEKHREIGQWPTDVRTESGRDKEDELLRSIQSAHDRQLYEHACNYKTADALHEYLNRTPLGLMRDPVRKYLDWLNTTTSESLKLTLSVDSIVWGKNTPNEDGIELDIKIDGKSVIIIPDLDSRKDTTSPIFGGSFEFTRRLDEKINLEVSLKETDAWKFNVDMGTGSKDRLRVKELNHLRINVATDGISNIVVFSLGGIPNEPALPTWSESKN